MESINDISCKLKNNKWICDIDDKEKEVTEVLTSSALAFSNTLTIFKKDGIECHLVRSIAGHKELMCLNHEEFERMKELILGEE